MPSNKGRDLLKKIIIVAMAENRTIGINNRLPWKIPADLKRFKSITMGHPIIMGRKTYESLGKPLPGRKNIVISRNKTLTILGAKVVNSVDAAISICNDAKKAFIIGGEQIYREAIKIADCIELTEISIVADGDAFFPPIDPTIWHQTDQINPILPPDSINYCFKKFERKTNDSSFN